MDDKEKLEVVLLMIEREIESISKKLESEKDEDSTLFPEIVGHKRWVFFDLAKITADAICEYRGEELE